MSRASSTHTNPMVTEPERMWIPGVAVRGKDAWAIGRLPPRLAPMRDLLTSHDPSDRAVLDDWIESQDWNVAADLWLLTKPTTFQRKITIMVIGRGTSIAHYPKAHEAEMLSRTFLYDGEAQTVCALAIAEAQRQLTIHRHAHWIRFVDAAAQTTPQGEEALMDHAGTPIAETGERLMHFRTRCKAPGCVISCTGTQCGAGELEAKFTNGRGLRRRRPTESNSTIQGEKT